MVDKAFFPFFPFKSILLNINRSTSKSKDIHRQYGSVLVTKTKTSLKNSYTVHFYFLDEMVTR